jgi:uncharacterized protein (TIGR03437 family)
MLPKKVRLLDASLLVWIARRKRVAKRCKLNERPLFALSNRKPREHLRQGNTLVCSVLASGLGTAVKPVLRASDRSRIGQTSDNADREAADANTRRHAMPCDQRHSLRRTWLKLLLSSVLLSCCRAQDWPMYLGDLSHSSYTALAHLNSGNISQIQQLWKTNVGAVLTSAVTTSKGFLFVGAWDGNFYSIDAATGAIFWKTFVGKATDPAPDPDGNPCMQGIGVSSQPVVSGNTVYVGGGDSAVYALDRDTGAVRWRQPLADPQSGSFLWSSIMLFRGALYVGIASLGDCPLVRGGLARIDLADPTHPLIRYLVPDGTLGAGVWSTPAIDEAANVIYVTTGNAQADTQDAAAGIWGSTLLTLDATTLDIKAHFLLPVQSGNEDMDWGSSPVSFRTRDGQQFIAANGKDGVMYVLRQPDLSLAWWFKLASGCEVPQAGCGSLSTPAFDGQTVFTGAGTSDTTNGAPGSVYAIDPVTHSVLWTYAARGVVIAPVTLTPGLVFVPTTAGLVALDAATGAELWGDAGGGALYSQAAMANGVLYATYANGDIIAWGVPGSGDTSTLVAAPTALMLRFTQGGPPPSEQTLNVYASAGPLNFHVACDAAWLTANLASGSAPSVVIVTAITAGLSPGDYNGGVTITPDGGGPAAVVRVKLTVNGPLPSVTALGVVNAASYQYGALAPGSLFSIFAPNLTSETSTASAAPWPTVLDGVSVKINGIAAPLYYLSPTQINAQVPFEVPNGSASLVVESNGAAANSVPITIAPAAPGIFLMPGNTRAAALNQDFSLNASGAPASVGSIITVYFTGQGPLDCPLRTGDPAPLDAYCTTLALTHASIGGVPAAVQFSGLAPRYVGLAQANIQVPDLPEGEYPVVLTIGGSISNGAIISVARP